MKVERVAVAGVERGYAQVLFSNTLKLLIGASGAVLGFPRLGVRLPWDADLDVHSREHSDCAYQVADPVYEMKTAYDVLVAVVAIHECPDGLRVLLPHEFKFIAVGLEQAPRAIAVTPAGVAVKVVCNEWVRCIEFFLGHFSWCVRHG